MFFIFLKHSKMQKYNFHSDAIEAIMFCKTISIQESCSILILFFQKMFNLNSFYECHALCLNNLLMLLEYSPISDQYQNKTFSSIIRECTDII